MRTLLAFLLLAMPLTAADFPTHTMKSDSLTLTVYLPDAEQGYYRSTRFDWSGVFTVDYGPHKLFRLWLSKPNPTGNDSIVGPCEEFGSTIPPLNYEDAKVGETFLKIGVGELVKPKEDKYRFFHPYTIKKAGTWTVEKGATETKFTQSYTTDAGYAYRYTKILTVNGSTIRIQHTLENTGKKTIHTDQYNHNFFNLDGDPVGKNYEIEFPFTPTASQPVERFPELVKFSGKKLTLTGALDKGSIYSEIRGYSKEKSDAGFTLRHTPSGVSMKVTGDQPLMKFNVWGVQTTLCPEPFVEFKIEPGQSAKWMWNYEFGK